MKRIRHALLYPQPALWQSGEQIKFKIRYLSPLRLSAAQSLVLGPLQSVWGVGCGALGLEVILSLHQSTNFFVYLPFTRFDAYAVMVLLWFYWCFELFARYPTCRFFLSQEKQVRIGRDHVIVGSRLLGKRYPRTNDTAFTLMPLSGQDIAYQNAALLTLDVSGRLKVPIAEICDPIVASRVIANANTALSLSRCHEHYDYDRFNREEVA